MVAPPFFQFDSSGPSDALKRLNGALVTEYTKAANDSAREFQNAVVRSFRPRSSPSDEWLQRRSGTLSENVGYQISGSSLETLQAKLFVSGVPYANLQEFGGTITPKNGKFLSIPLDAAKTPAGVTRGPFTSARDFIGSHKKEIFFLPRPNGSLLVVWKRPDGPARKALKLGNSKASKQTAVPIYVLVKSVKVPARFGFRKTWNELAQSREDRLKRATDRAVAKAVSGA